ncbi:MAG: DNA polymerase III subunit beta [Oligosphaeraceae bacterium]
MKFLVNTEKFLAGIRRVKSAVSTKSLNAMLNNILLEAEGDTLRLTAYDMELRIQTTVAATVSEGGSIAVPAKKFEEIISVLPMGDVQLETRAEAPEEIRLKCMKANYTLHGQRGDGFPTADPFVEDWSFSMGGKELVDCLARTVYARSQDETRQALNGVLFSIRGSMRTIAASDGRRLALVEASLDQEAKDEEGNPVDVPTREGEFILPCKVVAELIKNADQTKAVKIRLTRSMAVFENGPTIITSKLVDKNYPNYRSVIPVSFRNTVEIPRMLFADVLKRVRMMVTDGEDSASVTLSITEHSMRISASSPEYGNAEDSVDVELKGEPIEISFNPNYLFDPLQKLVCDTFQLHYNDCVTPVEMTGDPGFIYILMPMRPVLPPVEEGAQDSQA